MLNAILNIEKRNFDICFEMFCNMVSEYPLEFWESRVGGFISWQQFVHVFCGIHYWIRNDNQQYSDPFSDLKIYSELENDPIDKLAKNDVVDFMKSVSDRIEKYFDEKNDKWLVESSSAGIQYTNLDVINMQIRHIQYHLGCFECFLRANNVKTQKWID